ncbi:MAG: BamA/TamA family outer membrane protein [Gemmatimonadaceae bacterium]|nr:BamA/TamA family outer membrane protein [Chitinophagaceae bacterium]
MRSSRIVLSGLVICVLLISSSCSNTKYLPAGEALYDGAKIELTSAPNINKKKKKAIRQALASLTRPRPNKKILGMRLKLTAYNLAGKPKKEKGLRGWLKNKVGEPPVLLGDVDLVRNEQVLKADLENQGFFQATVFGDTVVKKKIAKAIYKVNTGIQYTIRSVSFQKDSLVMSALTKAILSDSVNTFLKAGDFYSFAIIKAERDRIDANLKENGFYYFSPDNLLILVDSTVGTNQVDLIVRVKPSTTAAAREVHTINNVYIFTNYNLRAAAADTLKRGFVYYKGYHLIDRRKLYNPKLFERTMLFNPGDVYKRSIHNLTLNRLITLGVFKFVKNRFESVPGVLGPQLETYYYLTPLPKKSIRTELNANTKSNNLTGTQLSVGWRNRNTFKAGELLTINAIVGSEIQYSGQLRGYNTYRGGIEASLAFPRFVVPFVDLNTRGGFVPKTTILLAYDLLNKNKLYTLNSFRAAFGYSWKESIKKEHEFNPISVNYVQPIRVTEEYRLGADTNQTLKKAIEQQFILGSTYSYTYNSLAGEAFKSGFYFNGLIDLSGNIAGLITGANVKKGKQKEVFGSVFSQYAKVETDTRYYMQLGEKSVLANRLIVGLGYPYGNSLSLPFIKQFFIGGNNSIRAFRSRALGPGSYQPPSLAAGKTPGFFPDQSGDMKLEANTEFRAKLFSVVNGAIFFDAGNIWLYNEDTLKPGARFSKSFLKEIAVGTGVGLRVDVSFLVLRLDLAFPLRKPYLPEGERWVMSKIALGNSQWRKENLVFNLAIGYPF